MSIYSVRPLTLGAVHTYPLASRKSKVSVRDFAKPPAANSSLTKFLDSLPNILAAEDLRHLLSAIHTARKQRKATLWGIGGHVIKVGLGPVLIDLMKRGFVSGSNRLRRSRRPIPLERRHSSQACEFQRPRRGLQPPYSCDHPRRHRHRHSPHASRR